jgi:UPF0716 protein FxsA
LGYILLAAFIGIPIAEIAVFIHVGERIGLWPTLGTVIVTAIVGTWLLRRQGLATLFRLQEEMNAGRVPLREMFDGACLLFAGALLLTPGFITDAMGFLLFLPPVRGLVMAVLAALFVNRGTIHVHTAGGFSSEPNWDQTGGGGPVIDGEYTDVSPDANPDTSKTDSDTIVRRIE